MEIPEITESEKYSLSNSGELRIQILTNSTIGYYVCVTTINSLGQYQTDGANIILSLPSEFKHEYIIFVTEKLTDQYNNYRLSFPQ